MVNLMLKNVSKSELCVTFLCVGSVLPRNDAATKAGGLPDLPPKRLKPVTLLRRVIAE